MKKIFILSLLVASQISYAQLSFNHLGVGFNYNGTGRPSSELVNSNFNQEDIAFASSQGSYGSLNRVFSSYEFGLKPSKYNFLFFDIDLLQGAEYLYSSNYESYQINDTNFSRNSYIDISSSLLGTKFMARITTPYKRRFIYNFGLGVEGLLAYNIDAEGSQSTSKNHWPSSTYESNRESFYGEGLDTYGSVNLVQQVGLAFRLGKDESSFPLNQTYLETDFQIINNFTTMNKTWSKYRTYGLTLSLVYEIK
ncbi:MAG: hypothetical protein HKP14_02520 [Bacteroidia bacterium]|nr:hypothetical protein [Bacteroidia bacterium]